MSQIIAFYRNQEPDHKGRYLRNIWKRCKNPFWAEVTHDYIQWLFPTCEPSQKSAHAPVLNASDLHIIHSDPTIRANMVRSLECMLSFYGFVLDTSKGIEVRKAHNFKSRSRWWLRKDNHNYLRITRILKCLCICSLERYAYALSDQLTKVYLETKVISRDTWNRWQSAVCFAQVEVYKVIRPQKEVFPISDLLQKSKYIQSRCGNDQFHTLPLKDDAEHYLDPKNWALPKEDVVVIQKYNQELCDYANRILNLVQDGNLPGAKIPVKELLNSIADFMPPWCTFPLYRASSLGWRMGAGEDYLDAFHAFLDSLTDKELEWYKEAYPIPGYMNTWSPYTESGGPHEDSSFAAVKGHNASEQKGNDHEANL